MTTPIMRAAIKRDHDRPGARRHPELITATASLLMLFNKTPERFWNLIASRYAASPIADKPAYERKIASLRQRLQADMSVLDIGCATGTQCGDIATSVQRVIGIDISAKLLTIAKQRMAERRIDNVEFIQATAFDGQFPSAGFDVVMAFHVLHFYPDTGHILRRINDLLKPGGLFISETASLGNQGGLARGLLSGLGRLGLLPSMTMLTPPLLENAIESAGFRIVDKTRFSDRRDAEFTYVAQKIREDL